MKKIIKHLFLILLILNSLCNTVYAELQTGNNFDISDSTDVIVPLPGNEKEDENQNNSVDENNSNNNSNNNSSGGGGSSYRPPVKPTDNTEETKVPEKTESDIITFTDINKNDWFYNDVKFVFDKKLMTGTSEEKFSPDMTLNRAMMITILHRISKDNSVAKTDIFNDVEKNSWYENAVNWGFENKIVTGTSATTFAPMDNLTREQLCVMLYNYTKRIGVETETTDISSYSDCNLVSDWAKDAISWAVKEKIITGKGNNLLASKDSATRAETAAVIRRYIEKIAETGDFFTDG